MKIIVGSKYKTNNGSHVVVMSKRLNSDGAHVGYTVKIIQCFDSDNIGINYDVRVDGSHGSITSPSRYSISIPVKTNKRTRRY
jgi:hypothetical protein